MGETVTVQGLAVPRVPLAEVLAVDVTAVVRRVLGDEDTPPLEVAAFSSAM